MVAPSRQSIECGYAFCTYRCERRLLKRHTQTKHRGGILKEKSMMQTVSDYIPFNTVKDSNAKESPSSLPTTSRMSPESSLSFILPHTVKEAVAHQSSVAPAMSPSPRLDEPLTFQVVANLERKIDALLHSNYTLRQEVLKYIENHENADHIKETANSNEEQVRHSTCRSLDELVKEKDNDLELVPEEDIIFCKTCQMTDNSAGVFKYDFSLGTDFGKQKLPKNFITLKQFVYKHFRSPTHFKNCKKLTKNKDIIGEHNTSIAKRVLRTAYHVVQSSLPQTVLPNLISIQHMNGLSMGDINHSVGLMGKLRNSFCDELLITVKKLCDDAPCISVFVDKVVLKRRTMDVIALHVVIPQATAGELVQCIVVGAPEITLHDSESLAQNWLSTLSKIGIKQTSQIAAIATDEQYHHNAIPQKLFAILNEAGNLDSCVATIWNQGHILELATNDAKELYWVSNAINIVTSVTKLFRCGKPLAEIEKLATDMKIPFRKPMMFSETRWIRYAAEVLLVFLINADVYRSHITVEKRTGNWRGDDNVTYFLENTNSVYIHVASLVDIFTVISKCSITLQDMQKLPWEKMEEFSNLPNIFCEMSTAVSNLTSAESCTSAEESISCELNSEKFDQIWPKLSTYSSPNVEEVRDIVAMLEVLQEELKVRTKGDSKLNRKETSNEAIFECVNDMRRVADLVVLRDTKSIADNLQIIMECFNKLKLKKLIPSHIDLPQAAVHKAFETLRDYKPDQTSGIGNQELFKMLWEKSQDDVFLKSYLIIVVRLWLINPCESTKESLVSVLKEVFGEHRNLDHTNAAKELLIRWNGPPLNQSDPLMEAVQKKLKMKFTRSCNRSKTHLGTVLSKYHQKSYPLQSLL